MFDLTLSDVLALVQTIAIITALLITVYFSRRQIQAFTVDLESRVLNDIDEKFHRIGEIFIERPELIRTIYNTPTTLGPDIPFTYYLLFFCAHIYHMQQRGLLQDNEWTGWFQWMRKAFQHGTLGTSWTRDDMRAWFDPAFSRFVEEEMLKPGPVAGTPPSAG